MESWAGYFPTNQRTIAQLKLADRAFGNSDTSGLSSAKDLRPHLVE
jgi:hypothetical protein